MKSDKLTKFLVTISLALFGIVFLLLAASSWGILSLSKFINYLEDGPMFVRILLGILFIAFTVGLVYVIIRLFKLGKAPKAAEMNLLTRSNAGESYISSDAVSQLVSRLLKKNKQIKSAETKVIPVEDGVNIDIKSIVFAGTDLTQLCSSIQNSVKYEIESTTGIPVRNVAVNIVKTVQGSEPVQEAVTS
ncbi:MAG: alkaline shock response membrane anchor protein AmaP, partial [Clostridia bacterium]|nr:alkaline shock response membrane anchor protein AmaP [Clostridia bacterium]